MRLHEAMKSLRMESGLSQRELAEKFEVDRRTIARWEAGTSYPKKKIVDKMIVVINQLNISKQCRNDMQEALSEGRRQGTLSNREGLNKIDYELLSKIVDDSLDIIYVIEVDTHNLIYLNKVTEKFVFDSEEDGKDKKCYEYLMHRNTPCNHCPLKNIVGYEFTEQILRDFIEGQVFQIRGKKMKWNGRDIYVTYVTNITKFEEHKK